MFILDHPQPSFSTVSSRLNSIAMFILDHPQPSFSTVSSRLNSIAMFILDHPQPFFSSVSSRLNSIAMFILDHPQPSFSTVSSGLNSMVMFIVDHPQPSFSTVSSGLNSIAMVITEDFIRLFFSEDLDGNKARLCMQIICTVWKHHLYFPMLHIIHLLDLTFVQSVSLLSRPQVLNLREIICIFSFALM